MTTTRERVGRPAGAPDATGLALEVDLLFAEARQRARRRRVYLAIAVAAMVVVIGAAGIIVLRPAAVPAGSARSGVHGPPQASATTGRLIVKYDGGTRAHPGGLEVIDPATGKTVRTLVQNPRVAAWKTVPLWPTQDGLQVSNDGKTVYFVEEGSSNDATGARALHLRSVNTAGGPVTDIGLGIEPTISPDGAMLAYLPETRRTDKFGSYYDTSDLIALFDARTGVTRTVRIPGMASGQPNTMLWLADSSTLVVHLSDVRTIAHGVAFLLPDKGPVINPKLTPKTLEVDAATLAIRTLPAATTRALEPTRTRDVTMEWAGSSGDLVQVLATNSRIDVPQFGRLGTIDLDTAEIHWDYALPDHTQLAGRVQPVADPGSWTDLVLVDTAGDGESWWEWSPGDGAPTKLFGKKGRQFSMLGLPVYS